MNIIDILKKKPRNVCPKCKSHHIKEITIWYDEKHDCNMHDMICNNCGYKYTIMDR